MTTQVLIANRGPKKIKIELQNRDSQGRFLDGGAGIIVGPGEFYETSVYDFQSFQVNEMKDE